MNKQQANALLKNIIKDYRENYDGDYFLYESVGRDVLTAVAEAYEDGKLTTDEFKGLSDFVLAEYLKTTSETVCPKLDTKDQKVHFKVESMTLSELRIEIEDKFSKIEDIEQVYKEGELADKELWEKQYKFALLGIFLAVKEMFNRDIKLENIEII